MTSQSTTAAETHVFTVDLMEYEDGAHILEIVGFTHATAILRDAVEFFGLG